MKITSTISRILIATALCAGTCTQLALAQSTPVVTLEVEVANIVAYTEDGSEVSKYATNPSITPAGAVRNFGFQEHIGDIALVNGKPARGVLVRNARMSALRSAPSPGQGIGDVQRTGVVADLFEFLNDDGTLIGTFVAYGPFQAGTSAAPGLFTVTGGSEAFLGMRGQFAPLPIPGTATVRVASVTEDPANRRLNGGGRVRFTFQLIPQFRPEIIIGDNGPAVVHSSNFSLVTAANPAKAGELLSLFARGLGPVLPRLAPGTPFPSNPLAPVNSPVTVLINGASAELLSATGYPGATDGYQVNFRVPAAAIKGTATVQLTSAWILGAAVSIPIQ